MKCLAIFLVFGAVYASIQSGYEESGYDYNEQEGGYDSYRDIESQDLSESLRQVKRSLQYAGAYSGRKLQEVQQYLSRYDQTGGEYERRVQQLIRQVVSRASQLKQQVYQYLEYSQHQYSQYSQYSEYEEYPQSGHYERNPGYHSSTILRQVRNVLQRTQFYTEGRLEHAQQILSQYQRSGRQPSDQEQQLIQEVKSEAYSLQQQVYQYLQYPDEQENYEQLQQPGQYEQYDGQVTRYFYQVQYILQTAQYYSQRQLSRAQYIFSQYGQTDYEPSEQVQQLAQEVKEQSRSLREQIYADTEYFVQDSGSEDYSPYSQHQYYGYHQYSQYGSQSYYSGQEEHGRQSSYYGYQNYGDSSYESNRGYQYDRELTAVLSRVRYVLQNAQYRSQQRLRYAQQLYAQQRQSDDQPDQQVHRLLQQLRSQASSLQQQVYEYLQYNQGYGEYQAFGNSNFRSLLRRVLELVEQGVETEIVESYVTENFPSGSDVAESIRQHLHQGREELRRYLEETIESGYSGYYPSSSDYQRVRSSFESRYGLPYSDDYSQFARYLVQTYHRDLSTASTSSTVSHIAQHFLAHVGQVGEGVLQHALEFFRQYRSELGEYYYQAVEEAVRQQLSS